MAESTDARQGDDAPAARRFDGAGRRRVPGERHMRAILVVIA